MYANHEVTNLWNPYTNTDDKTLLFDPRIDWEQWKTIVKRVIDQYFHRPNYVKIDGCPVFSIWDLNLFADGFGSMEEAGKAMAYFRDEVKRQDFRIFIFSNAEETGKEVHLRQIIYANRLMYTESTHSHSTIWEDLIRIISNTA